MKLPLTDEEFEYIYSRVPRLNVEIIIRTEKGVVLIKRTISPWIGYWHLPGGRVYMNETLEDAVRRIATYEAGVQVEVKEMVGHLVYPSIRQQDSYGWPVGIAFMTNITGGELNGSELGKEIKVFTSLPEKIISEQKVFLEQNNIV